MQTGLDHGENFDEVEGLALVADHDEVEEPFGTAASEARSDADGAEFVVQLDRKEMEPEPQRMVEEGGKKVPGMSLLQKPRRLQGRTQVEVLERVQVEQEQLVVA